MLETMSAEVSKPGMHNPNNESSVETNVRL